MYFRLNSTKPKPKKIMNFTKHLWQKNNLMATVAALFLALPLHAEEKTWTGLTDGSWLSGGNWSPNALATELDSVLYDVSSAANLSQTLDQGWSVQGIRVAAAPGPGDVEAFRSRREARRVLDSLAPGGDVGR